MDTASSPDGASRNTSLHETSPLLRCDNVGFVPRGHTVLQDISLDIKPGQMTTIIGPIGAGKSTLLKILLNIVSPTVGRVHRKEGIRVGYVPQKFTTNPLLPLEVSDFLELFKRKDASLCVRDILDTVGAGPLYTKSFHTLSGGELQRVLLANALQNDPHLLVLDEPTQGLDIRGQKIFYDVLDTLRKRTPSLSILLASHEVYMVLKTSDVVVCLQKHICCVGAPHVIQEHPNYLKLFGESVPLGLVPYTHHHTHVHEDEEGAPRC